MSEHTPSTVFLHPHVAYTLQEAGLYIMPPPKNVPEQLVYTSLCHELAVKLVSNRTYYKNIIVPFFNDLIDYCIKYNEDELVKEIGYILNAMPYYVESKLANYDIGIGMMASELGIPEANPDNADHMIELIDLSVNRVDYGDSMRIIENMLNVNNQGAVTVEEALDEIRGALS